MTTCLLCRRNGICNIMKTEPAKQDFIAFLGAQVWGYLKNNDVLCNICVIFLHNIVSLKRNLFLLISNPEFEDQKPASLEKWQDFAEINLKGEIERLRNNITPTRQYNNGSPTSDDLLIISRIDPYESPLELKIAERERIRSQSRLSTLSAARSDADSEVANAFFGRRKRRKRRGHSWTRRKNGRYSRPNTEPARATTRSSTYLLSPSVWSNNNAESVELSCPPARIRFEDYLKCSICGLGYIETIDYLNDHKKTKHNLRATHHCNECSKKYTSSEDLDIHKKKSHKKFSKDLDSHKKESHMNSTSFTCVICQKEFGRDTDLMNHWKRHVANSVPCPVCGKRYLNRNVCKKHERSHSRNLSRIDYDKTTFQSESTNNFNNRFILNGNE